jgi:hypothetical protein
LGEACRRQRSEYNEEVDQRVGDIRLIDAGAAAKGLAAPEVFPEMSVGVSLEVWAA